MQFYIARCLLWTQLPRSRVVDLVSVSENFPQYPRSWPPTEQLATNDDSMNRHTGLRVSQRSGSVAPGRPSGPCHPSLTLFGDPVSSEVMAAGQRPLCHQWSPCSLLPQTIPKVFSNNLPAYKSQSQRPRKPNLRRQGFSMPFLFIHQQTTFLFFLS